jgi:WhiB family redox-sensing transcriptional regulator
MAGVDLVLPRSEDWMREGVCAQVDPNVWHPEKGGSVKAAVRICRTTCPVAAQCLNYALEQGERLTGVWGGTTERERRVLRRARKTQLDLLASEIGPAA